MARKLPAPWNWGTHPGGYVVKDATGHALAYCYGHPTFGDADIAKGQGHSYACAGRPSPEVAHHTADQTLATSVDLDERSIAAGAGIGWVIQF